MCHGVAPLPLLADYSGGTGSRTAEASRSRLLALAAGRHHGLVRMGRVSQSNRHDNCKHRYSESLQHSFGLPSYALGHVPNRNPSLVSVSIRTEVTMMRRMAKIEDAKARAGFDVVRTQLERLREAFAKDPRLARACATALEQLDKPMPLSALADAARTTERTLSTSGDTLSR